MNPYLLQKADRYAKKHLNQFVKMISSFNVDTTQISSSEICNSIHTTYKKDLCKFDTILNFGYLFENNCELYNELKYKIKFVSTEVEFRDIYRFELGKIYKKMFGEYPRQLSLIAKVDGANEEVSNLLKCVQERIKYHYWCKDHHKKYDVGNHEFELLRSIFLYNRIVDIQTLLNSFRDKYLGFKENIEKERKELEQRQAREREAITERQAREREAITERQTRFEDVSQDLTDP